MTNWPEGFPNQCPPEDAVLSHDVFFRLIDADPVVESDFWSHKLRLDEGLDRPRRNDPDPCLSVGVSVFDTADGANRARGAFGALRTKKVAAGSLAGSGVVKKTTRTEGHHTWWRPTGDVAWSNFAVTA